MKHRTDENYQIVHCIGNGRICAYAKGTEVFQTFGPDYSAANAYTMSFNKENITAFESKRKAHTDTWQHTLYKNSETVGTLTDFAAADKAVFYRVIDAAYETETMIGNGNVRRLFRLPDALLPNGGTGFFGEIPEVSDLFVYGSDDAGSRSFRSSQTCYAGLLCLGGTAERTDGGVRVLIRKGTVCLIYSYDYEEIIRIMCGLSETDIAKEREESEAVWEEAARKRTLHLSDAQLKYEDVADDVAVMIKAQQAESGAVLAGYNYHLSYIRDSFGALSGLLSTGCYDEAKKLLLYYRDVFARYGTVKNAQSPNHFAFHIHENDDVEITGYMILMVSDYVRKTGETSFWKEMFPLVWWSVLQQHARLKHGMLPFNGDETYIAGGHLPRTVITHGSLEAPLLYHTACRRMMGENSGCVLSEEERGLLLRDCREIEEHLDENFLHDGQLACNNPHYYAPGEEPLIRKGVSFCNHGQLRNIICLRNAFGDYVCPECVDKYDKPLMHGYDTIFYQPSALMMPIFMGTELIRPEQAEKLMREYINKVTNANEISELHMVGYDVGLMLAYEKQPQIREKLVDTLMKLRDETGVWAEYYSGGSPVGTLCRPWESGLNVTALLAE